MSWPLFQRSTGTLLLAVAEDLLHGFGNGFGFEVGHRNAALGGGPRKPLSPFKAWDETLKSTEKAAIQVASF